MRSGIVQHLRASARHIGGGVTRLRVRAGRVLTVAVLATLAGCGDWVTSEAQARPLADSALARYAAHEHLPLAAFRSPEVTTDGPHSWSFEYRSSTRPERRLRVRVNGRGRTEPSAELAPDGTPERR